jgi:hypothetical protein
MTRLRKMMLEELQRRNYSENTTRHYIRTVEDFARRFQCSPDRLGPRHIREYQAELFQKGKSPGTVTQRLAALRFFYVKTLKKAWSSADTPYPKRAIHLPTILSREEVAQLIDAASTPFHRTLLMVLYATGIRRAELTKNCVSTGSGCGKNRATGSFPARKIIVGISQSTPKRFGMRAAKPPSELASAKTCSPTRSVIASPPIYSKQAPISASFRLCWVIAI